MTVVRMVPILRNVPVSPVGNVLESLDALIRIKLRPNSQRLTTMTGATASWGTLLTSGAHGIRGTFSTNLIGRMIGTNEPGRRKSGRSDDVGCAYRTGKPRGDFTGTAAVESLCPLRSQFLAEEPVVTGPPIGVDKRRSAKLVTLIARKLER